VFVGDTPKTDIVGAHAADMRVIWLNRDSSPLRDGIVPDATIHSLSELQDTIAGL
jgi:FMN phosphatase YigB (HAD superfamily)